MMSETELGWLGTKAYFPQTVKRSTDYAQAEKKMMTALMRQGKTSTEAREIINTGDWKRTGLRQFGSIDQQRRIPGAPHQSIFHKRK